MEFQDVTELNLRLVDEEAVSLLQEPSLNQYSRIPSVPINFEDIFDVQESDSNSSSKHSRFFGQDNYK